MKIRLSIKKHFYLGLIFLSVPCLLFAWARFYGYLPSQEAWKMQAPEATHGPWHKSEFRFAFALPFLGPAFTMLYGYELLRMKRFGFAYRAIALAILQVGMALLPIAAFFWAIK